MKIKIIFLVVAFLSLGLKAQEENNKEAKKITNKGKFFVYWGWNWSSYTDSDIRFKGDNYDFTLTQVKAQDRQTPFSFNDYFNPSRVTIPQTNYRIGYFFKENYTISIGVDHMKYVMISDQNVTINGEINDGNATYDGVYDDETINLSSDFLLFEHTDGLNYVNVELKRFDDVSHWFGLNLENLQINLTEGIGAGILYPRTNTTLLGKERHDDFHLSGYGMSIGAGVNITFLKHFFIQADLKGGYINMSDVRTTNNVSDSASQSFYFFENTFLIGGKFRIF